MRAIIFIYLSLVLLSCNNDNNSKTTTENNKPESTPSRNAINPADSLLNVVAIAQLPFTDSTNFNNFNETTQISPDIADTLKLKALNSPNAAYFIRYKIPFSPNFISVVITYPKGDNELFTTLINYDKNYNIIDKVDISYDEVAESVLTKTATISTDKIRVTRTYDMEETPEIEYQTYQVQQDGKFVLIK